MDKHNQLHPNYQPTTDYEVKKVIGKGTFGIVYLVRWKDEEEVALKRALINPKYKNREIQILSSLNHPNIIRLITHFECVEDEKRYSNLVMEYVPITLSVIIREKFIHRSRKINLDKNILYMKGMLEGLAYLEDKHVCHRDIKPSNILINNKNGDVKICDFGSAKKLKPGEKSITYICSRYYRAPELILGCISYSNKIDMWSLGCVFAEMFIGKPIFDGLNTMDQLVKIVKVLGTPTKGDLVGMKVGEKNQQQMVQTAGIGLGTKLKKHCPQIPEIVVNFLEKILVYDVEKRYSPKQALQHDIFDFPKEQV